MGQLLQQQAGAVTGSIKQANWLVTVGVRLKPEFPGMSRDNSTTAIPCRGDDEFSALHRSLSPPSRNNACADPTVLARVNVMHRVVEKYPRVYGHRWACADHLSVTSDARLPNRKLLILHA